MQSPGFSPYQLKKPRAPFKLPEFSGGLKKGIFIVLGVLVGLWLLVYVSLGDLRFFMAHYLGLTFFSKNYVILLQNNYEARPGGGFISAYGTLDTFMGFPTGMSFKNSYDIDTPSYVTPPPPQEKFLKNEWYQGYTFRDANWNPSFPEASKDLIDFYKKKFPDRDVDGIIVVNFSMIENWVDALGGVTVNGELMTKKNLFSALEQSVSSIDRHNEAALANRKNVLGDLASALRSKAKWHPLIAKAVLEQALKDKDLYFWFANQSLEDKILARDWGDALQLPEKSDFVSLNIANLGAKKADRYMQREIHQYVNIAKELPEMTTEVTIRYPGFTNMYADDYKGYARFIIPAKATIVASPSDSRMESLGDFTGIGTEVVIPAGSKTTLTYTYTLPRSYFDKDTYNLRLTKQSGVDDWYFVTVETPADTGIQSPDFTVRENRAMWNGLLTSDHDLSLSILPDKLPPYPIEQVFEDAKTITIYWNEPLDSASVRDAGNYAIKDMNITDADKTDEVKTVYAELEAPSVIKLEVDGVTDQPLERYQIQMKDVRDAAGNVISPNPKIITVVQRYKAGAQPAAAVNTTDNNASILPDKLPATDQVQLGNLDKPLQ